MQITAAITNAQNIPEMIADLERQLFTGNRSADLVQLFISTALIEHFSDIVTTLHNRLGAEHLLAVSAESVLGIDREIELAPGISALAFWLDDGARVTPFHLSEDEWPALLSDDETLHARLGSDDLRAFFMAADPFTTPIVQLLDHCSRVFPEAAIFGGMASGIAHAGEARLAIDGEIHSAGLIGVAFRGDIEIDCVISQGCRPVGPTFEITRCEQNVIHELNGKPALAVIDDMISGIPLLDRQLLATGGLQIGRVVDEGKGNLGRGDFVMRSLMGVRRESGAIVVGDLIHTGETVQFHLRDAKSAEDDLRLLLQGEMQLADNIAGALLVTCNSRGERFFEMPNHDITVVRQVLGEIPIAGFFAAGEFGPLSRKNFIHAHTAALALFRG